MLYEARRPDVHDSILERSISLLEAKMVEAYAREIGNLDATPGLLLDRRAWEEIELGDIERGLLERLASGASYREALHRSPLDEHATLRVFASFVRRGVLERPRLSRSTQSGSASKNAYLAKACVLEGYVCAGIVDTERGQLIEGDGLDAARLAKLATSCSELVGVILRAHALSDAGAGFDELTVSLGSEVQLIRPIAEASNQVLFVVLERAAANVTVARLQMQRWVATSKQDGGSTSSASPSQSMMCTAPCAAAPESATA